MKFQSPYCISKIAPQEVLDNATNPVQIQNPRPRLRTMCTLEEYTHLRQDFEDDLMDKALTKNAAELAKGWGSGSPTIWESFIHVWFGVYRKEADNRLHEMILVDIFYYVLSNKDYDGGWDDYWQEQFNFLHDRTGWSREYRISILYGDHS